VKKENGLRTGKVMSHIVFFGGIPGFHKLLVQTDGGMILYPTLEDKKAIIENAVQTLRSIGYTLPKVAVLAAIEKVNPKMVETVEADALMQMNRTGELRDCVVEGPVSYDVAMSREIAEHKGYKSENCGNFDVLVVPNMNAGNILGKCFTVTCGAQMAGIVVGAKAPVVLTSRGSSAMEKFYSIALASLISAGGRS
jgi:phosphate butyryltransferase